MKSFTLILVTTSLEHFAAKTALPLLVPAHV